MIFPKLFTRSKQSEPPNVNYGKTHCAAKISHVIFFRDGHLDAVKKVRGIRSDSDMARALGITRAYYSLLKTRRKPVTHEVICKLAEITGTLNDGWWAGLEIKPVHYIDPNHPSNNMAKYKGEKPYDHYSESAEMRRGEVEEKS